MVHKGHRRVTKIKGSTGRITLFRDTLHFWMSLGKKKWSSFGLETTKNVIFFVKMYIRAILGH